MALMQKPSISNADRKIELDEARDVTVSLEEGNDVEAEQLKYSSVADHVLKEYNRSKDKRRNDEERWLKAWHNYRGIYGPETQFREDEKSKVFVKVTKTKVLAGYAQITDVLFAGARFPIGIQSSKVPIGVDEVVSVETQKTPEIPGKPPEAANTTIARPEISDFIKKKFKDVPEEDVRSGQGKTPTSVNYYPAAENAKEMEKNIHDQLESSNITKHVRSFVFEMCLLGTGVMKGALAVEKEYPKWDAEGNYVPKTETVPESSFVSVWNIYPDADARNIFEAEKMIERHRMSRSDLINLKKRPYFRSKSIDKVLEYGPNYEPEDWERTIEDNPLTTSVDRYEVLEYWGTIDKEAAEDDMDFDIPRDLRHLDQFQVNIWVCHGQIIRMVMNPFTPSRLPYYVCPYEINPYSFFGIGLAENMEDTQLLMNGFMRMAVDNAALSGNLLIEVNEDALEPGQNMDIYPGKIFRRASGPPGQAVFGTSFPNISNELFMMFDKARQIADESTGMPSYSHGGVGVPGVGKTASGMSMLMGAAAQNIKAVVRNIDDYLLSPLGKDYFAFNMQFNFDKKFTEGDLEVYAQGTESLMRNEIRSQRLLQLAQTAAGNPSMAPLIKWDYILREFVTSLDLDEDKCINDPREALIQAMLMRQHAEAMGSANPNQPNGGGPNSTPNPNDPTGTGNGNIAPGAAPGPGAQGFTGGGGATGAGAAANQESAQASGGNVSG